MLNLMLVILLVTIALFIWGKYPPDIVALISMISLFLVGILDIDEALSGFSNPVVVMIASLFIIGEGLSNTGWTALAGQKLMKLANGSKSKLLMIVTLGAGLLSGLVSNTGTVATLLPVTISSAWKIGTLPSQVLMPVAFGSNTGGLLTLTGTPPNIIVSNALSENGMDTFSFFEFALIGLPLLVIAVLYFRYVGYKLLPKNQTNNKPVDIESTMHKWIEAYKVENDYYKLRIRSLSPLINTSIGQWELERKFDVTIIRIKRRHPNPLKGIQPYTEFPDPSTMLYYHDIITVKGDTEAINRFMIRFRLGLLPLEPIPDEMRHNLINQEVGMAEAIVTPKSFLVGRQVRIGNYFKRFGIQLMGASRNNKPLLDHDITIKAGDAFLLRGQWQDIDQLKSRHENVVICGSPEGLSKDVDIITSKSYVALAALILMIVLLVFNIVPGAVAALISAGLVLLAGCVPISKAYKSISWVSVIMIAAMIPMGLALQKTGLAQIMANGLVDSLGKMHPTVLLAGIFLITAGFSQVINNSATAVLMAPIVILAASALDVSAKPFMITVAASASTAFLTPVGTTTNAMVMTAGAYKFKDYLKVGTPLLFIFLIIITLMVPLIWPFH